MNDVVRDANHGVTGHGLRASVSARIANLREEGGEQVGIPILPGAVSHERWPSACYLEGTARRQLLLDMRGESNSLLDGLMREEETSSNSSVEVQGDTDESTENANYSVDIEQVPVRVDPVQAFTNLEAE